MNKVISWKTFFSISLMVILIGNMFSRTITEHVFGILVVSMLYLAVRKQEGFSWGNLLPSFGSKFDFVWLFWFGALFLSYFVNGNFNSTAWENILDWRWMLATYLLARAFIYSGISEKLLGWFSVLVSAVCIVILLRYFIYPEDLVHLGWPNRLKGAFDGPNDLAHGYIFLFAFLSGVSLHLMKVSKTEFKIALIGAWFLTLMAVFFTFTRSVWIASIVAFVIMAYVARPKFALLSTLIIVAVLVIVYFANLAGFKERIDSGLNPSQSYDIERVVLWKTNWLIFLDHPVFGVGYRENVPLLRRYYDLQGIPPKFFEAHAHNQYLNVLSGVGAIGLAFFLLILIGTLYFALKNYRSFEAKDALNKGIALGVIGCHFASITAAFFDCNFDITYAKYYIMTAWALILYQRVKLRGLPNDGFGGSNNLR